MAQVATNEFRAGLKVELDGQPFVIVSNEFVKPGKGQAFNRVRLKHLLQKRVVDKTFKSGEKLDLADVEETEMRMLYRDTDGVVFMNESTFEQTTISQETLGDVDQWLMEDKEYSVILYNGQPVLIEPPTFVEMRLTETEPGARGDTSSGRVLKPGITESGAKVQIPIFINEGEMIKIDTRTGEYVSRVKE